MQLPDFQRYGSVPQALATLIGAIVIAVGWAVTNSQSLSRDLLAKQREQTSLVAEYAALAYTLKDTDDAQTYRRANQLSWQLFLWLPTDAYRKLGRGLAHNNKELADALVDVRKILLGREAAGTLGPDDIIIHGPNIALQK